MPEYDDPSFKRKVRTMIDGFKSSEEKISDLEKQKDELNAKLSYSNYDEEDIASCNYELEDLARSI